MFVVPSALSDGPPNSIGADVVGVRVAEVRGRRRRGRDARSRPRGPAATAAHASSHVDLDELAVAPHERPAQPVGILVQLLQRRALRADEAVAEHVVAVAADARDLLAAVAVAGAA